MPQEMRSAIGARLREARRRARLTQEDVATDFLCSRQAVSSWESGRTLPSLLEFRALASLYAVSSDALLFDMQDVAAAGSRAIDEARSRPAPLGLHDK